MDHLQNNLQRFNLVLWQYSDDTTKEKLLRHHKICQWIVLPCIFSSAGMFSTIAQCLIFRSKLDFILMIIFTAFSLLLIVPATFCYVWMYEIEQVLIKRGITVPSGKPIEKRVQMWALKLMLCSAGLVILGSIIRKG